MREIILKIYLDKMYTFKTKSKRNILKDYLLDIFGSNIRLSDNRFYFPVQNSNKSMWLVMDKNMRIISLNEYLQNTVVLFCIDLDFVKKHLDLPYWKKIIDRNSCIIYNQDNLEIKGQNEIIKNNGLSKEAIKESEEKKERMGVNLNVRDAVGKILKKNLFSCYNEVGWNYEKNNKLV